MGYIGCLQVETVRVSPEPGLVGVQKNKSMFFW